MKRSLLVLATFVLGVAQPAWAEDAGPDSTEPESGRATAGPPHMVVLPAMLLVKNASSVAVRLPRESEVSLQRRLGELTDTLRDAAYDLGYEVDLDGGEPPYPDDDAELLAKADAEHTTYVLAALEVRDSTYRLRVALAQPGRSELRIRYADVGGNDVLVKALVLMRGLLKSSATSEHAAPAEDVPKTAAAPRAASSSSKAGRAVLAANTAVLGALTAFSVQRASGNDDPRVLYPLLAIGSGIGLAGGLLAADEWKFSTSQSWFLASGAWWGAASGVLLAHGGDVQPTSDRYVWALGGGLAGATVVTALSALAPMDEGDLTLQHSGATLGLVFGGLTEAFVRGSTRETPSVGAGVGAASGLVLAGGAAALLRVPPSRVLLVDLGVALGGLGGAALSSPLVFQNVSAGDARGFVAATASGMVLGAAAAMFFTRHEAAATSASRATPHGVAPLFGVIGQSQSRQGSAPAWGAGVAGSF